MKPWIGMIIGMLGFSGIALGQEDQLKFEQDDVLHGEIIIVTEEMQKLLNSDPCYLLFQEINTRATSDPLWEHDYLRAHYHAFLDVVTEHSRKILKENK